MNNESKQKIKDSLLFLLEDLKRNCDTIVEQVNPTSCTELQLTLKGFAIDKYPEWVVSYTNYSQSFVQNYQNLYKK